MGKYTRVFIAILMVLGIVILARNKIAWAANPEAKISSSVQAQLQPSAPLRGDDDCDKDNNKDKDKCKDKDKDKCKDKDDDDCGTVQPPPDNIEVCERGDYSVGGVATLDIRNLRGKDCLTAHTRNPDPAVDQLPAGAGTILADVIVLTLPPKEGNVKICFAVPPGEQVKIYSSAGGSWTGLKTKVKDGIACAEVNKSGDYTLVGQ